MTELVTSFAELQTAQGAQGIDNIRPVQDEFQIHLNHFAQLIDSLADAIVANNMNDIGNNPLRTIGMEHLLNLPSILKEDIATNPSSLMDFTRFLEHAGQYLSEKMEKAVAENNTAKIDNIQNAMSTAKEIQNFFLKKSSTLLIAPRSPEPQ